MPVEILQQNKGTSVASTNHAVSLLSGTTAGTSVIVVLMPSTTFTAPTGFESDSGSGAVAINYSRKPDVSAGETSWTFTTGVSGDLSWQAFEVSGLDLNDPTDVSVAAGTSTANGATLSSGTTSQSAGTDLLVFGGFGALKTSGATASWSGYTNGFTELDDESAAATVSVAVASTTWESTIGSTFSTTATLARSDAANSAVVRVQAYRSATSAFTAPLASFMGFEWGTHGGMGNSSGSNPQGSVLSVAGTFGTNYIVQASSARTSGYGLRIVASASIVGFGFPTLSSARAVSFGGNVRVISGTGVVVVAQLVASTNLQLVYDTSTNKYGLRWGAGTPVYQSGTTALSTWVWIDGRAKIKSSTWHAEWRIETGTDTYTDQTSVDLTGQASSQFTSNQPMTLGMSTSQTMTAEYDDWVLSPYYAAHPLNPHTVKIMVPETTGASVVGTSTNFSKFTANGTLAAWGSDAGALLDEVPPTISASSDGVVQTAIATSDYMKFPMANPTLASDECVGAVRAVIPTWGGTGTGTGTLWLAVYDGTTETVVDAGSVAYDGDSLTAASGTYPFWRTAMIPAPLGGWTPTAINALEGRVGKSSDATPDMGVSAFYLEYAVRKVNTYRQVTIEDPISATVDLRVNPYNSASVSYVITNNDATRSVNFNYSISGTPQTPVTVSPSTNQTVPVSADAFGDISDLSLEPQ